MDNNDVWMDKNKVCTETKYLNERKVIEIFQ